MAIEENILSAEELALVDPFAEPSQESVLAFPEIQHKADGTSVHHHADEGTRSAVDHLQDQVAAGETIPENPEPASYPQPFSTTEDDQFWEKRLQRLITRRSGEPLPPVETTHDFITEEEEAEVIAEELEDGLHLDIEDVDSSILEELENIQHNLQRIGGVSRDEIVAMESLLECPGYFGNPRAFSATYTKSRYNVTMESLGSKIKELVKELVKWCIEQCKRLAGLISKALGTDAMRQHMTVSLVTKRQELLVKARRVDAVYGLKSFKSMTSSTGIPPYKEATSTENFCIRYLDYRTKMNFQKRFTIGMRMIVENSGLSGHVKNLRGELDRSLKQVDEFLSILQKTDFQNWSNVNDQFNTSGLNSLCNYWGIRSNASPNDMIAEYRTAVHFAFRQEDTRAKRPGEFVKIANYTNPFSDNPTFGKTMGAGMDRVARSLKDLENKVSRLDDSQNYTVQTGKLNEVNRRLTLVQNLFTLYLAFARYYEAFYITLIQPIIVLNRQLDVFSAKSMIMGTVSKESLTADYGMVEAFNECPVAGVKETFTKLYQNNWLSKADVENEEPVQWLIENKLAYVPKVIDLEQETPDYGITPAGLSLACQLGLPKEADQTNAKVNEVLNVLWDDERLGSRELLRHHGREGFNRFDDSQIAQITDDKSAIGILKAHGLVVANKPYHPIHDADEGTWVVTDLGMEIAKLL